MGVKRDFCGFLGETMLRKQGGHGARDILVTRRIRMATGVAPCVSIEPFNIQDTSRNRLVIV
jgi:hypothetical protein